MKVGEVVEYNGSRWRVSTANRSLRLNHLERPEGSTVEVPDDLDTNPREDCPVLKVLFHPAKDWHVVVAPIRPKSGAVLQLKRGGRTLVMMEEWVPGDFRRPGGSLFLNPSLNVRHGEVLVAEHKDGSLSRIYVTGNCGSVSYRKKRATQPPQVKQPSTALDRLLRNNPFDNDEE